MGLKRKICVRIIMVSLVPKIVTGIQEIKDMIIQSHKESDRLRKVSPTKKVTAQQINMTFVLLQVL